jgi:Tfp pilus assembly protein PilP
MAVLIAALFIFYGCSSPPPPPPKPVAQQAPQPAAAVESETLLKGTKFEDGYDYEQRNRRDPFITLVVPTKKKQKAEELKIGTLEGYDISEFVLAGIAKRGHEYFALLTTPDHRSFTVVEGNVIGLNKGRVEEITENKIVFVEYSRDYRGDLKPKRITLEFVKGESR